MNKETEVKEPIRMPLWRNAAKEIVRIHKPGDFIEVSWLLNQLRREPPTTQREAMDFSFEISEIRSYIEHAGLYLSGRGFHGEKLQLLPPRENGDIMEGYQRRGINQFRRCVILGNATDRTALTEQEAARHESILCRGAARLALLSRRKPQELLSQLKPKKLKKPQTFATEAAQP